MNTPTTLNFGGYVYTDIRYEKVKGKLEPRLVRFARLRQCDFSVQREGATPHYIYRERHPTSDGEHLRCVPFEQADFRAITPREAKMYRGRYSPRKKKGWRKAPQELPIGGFKCLIVTSVGTRLAEHYRGDWYEDGIVVAQPVEFWQYVPEAP